MIHIHNLLSRKLFENFNARDRRDYICILAVITVLWFFMLTIKICMYKIQYLLRTLPGWYTLLDILRKKFSAFQLPRKDYLLPWKSLQDFFWHVDGHTKISIQLSGKVFEYDRRKVEKFSIYPNWMLLKFVMV